MPQVPDARAARRRCIDFDAGPKTRVDRDRDPRNVDAQTARHGSETRGRRSETRHGRNESKNHGSQTSAHQADGQFDLEPERAGRKRIGATVWLCAVLFFASEATTSRAEEGRSTDDASASGVEHVRHAGSKCDHFSIGRQSADGGRAQRLLGAQRLSERQSVCSGGSPVTWGLSPGPGGVRR